MKLIIAQVYEDSQSAITAFDEFTDIIKQWSNTVTLDLKINKRELEVQYGVHSVKYYSLKKLEASICL